MKSIRWRSESYCWCFDDFPCLTINRGSHRFQNDDFLYVSIDVHVWLFFCLIWLFFPEICLQLRHSRDPLSLYAALREKYCQIILESVFTNVAIIFVFRPRHHLHPIIITIFYSSIGVYWMTFVSCLLI